MSKVFYSVQAIFLRIYHALPRNQRDKLDYLKICLFGELLLPLSLGYRMHSSEFFHARYSTVNLFSVLGILFDFLFLLILLIYGRIGHEGHQ